MAKKGAYGAYEKERPSYGRLGTLRKANNYTMEFVADHIGVARQTYNAWEIGKRTPDIENIWKLADLYRVSIDYLVGKSTYTSEAREDIGKVTGLSDAAIKTMKYLKKNNTDFKAIYAHVLNYIITDLSKGDIKKSILHILWNILTSKGYPHSEYIMVGRDQGSAMAAPYHITFSLDDIMRIETQKYATELMDKSKDFAKWADSKEYY